jgi:hypothetical protein
MTPAKPAPVPALKGAPLYIFYLGTLCMIVGINSALLGYVLPADIHHALNKILMDDYMPQIPVLASHQPAERIHRWTGALWMFCCASQFCTPLRRKYIAFHRFLGYVAMALRCDTSAWCA